LQEQYQAIQDAGAEILAVVVDDLDAVEGMCERMGITYPVLSDADHQVSEAYGVFDLLGDGLAAPGVFVIGTDGRVLWSRVGQTTLEPVPASVILEHLP
jgi:peroxiredoxin